MMPPLSLVGQALGDPFGEVEQCIDAWAEGAQYEPATLAVQTGTHTRGRGRLYRYYVCLGANWRGHDTCPVRWIAASEGEGLSGGMKQKLGLCCPLIHDPDLLILDEPTTGVDPLSRRQFWDLIDAIRRGRPGMSVMVATAYMDEAPRFDWLIAMDAGRVLATGSTAELLAETGSSSLDDAFIALRRRRSAAGTTARW